MERAHDVGGFGPATGAIPAVCSLVWLYLLSAVCRMCLKFGMNTEVNEMKSRRVDRLGKGRCSAGSVCRSSLPNLQESMLSQCTSVMTVCVRGSIKGYCSVRGQGADGGDEA